MPADAEDDGVAINQEELDRDASEWAEGLCHAVTAASLLDHVEGHVLKLVGAPNKVARILAGLGQREKESGAFWGMITCQTDPTPLLKALMPEQESKAWFRWQRTATRVIVKTRTELSWAGLTDACYGLLTSGQWRSDEQSATALLDALNVLRDCHALIPDRTRQLRSTLVSSHGVQEFLGLAIKQKHSAAVGAWLGELLAFGTVDVLLAPYGRGESSTLLSQLVEKPEARRDEVTALVEDTAARRDPAPLLRALDEPRLHKLAAEIVARAVDVGRLGDILSPRTVVAAWPQVREACRSVKSSRPLIPRVVMAMVENLQFQEQLTATEFTPELADLAAEAVRAGIAANPEVRKWIEEGIARASKAEWLQSVIAGTGLVDAASALRYVGDTPRLGREFGDAFEEFAGQVDRGKAKPTAALLRLVGDLAASLDSRRRAVLSRTLRDAVQRSNAPPPDAYFVLCEVFLNDSISSSDSDFIRRTARPIVERGPHRARAWVAQVIEEKPGVLQASPVEDLEDFRERVRAAVKGEADTEQVQLLQRIAARLPPSTS